MGIVFGGIEGGGTKFVLLIGSGPDAILDETQFPTTTPDETLGRAIEFFRRSRAGVRIAALGMATFGPIDVDPASPTYGYITTTPKPYWPHTNVVGALHEELGLPIGWDTDVNGAALGEGRWGAGRDADPLVYITVGTGIGGGALVHGQPVHGLLHPEMGHLRVPAFEGDTFPGICPYHGRCLEGLACGPALQQRTGRAPQEIAPDDPVWETEAYYLAAGFINIVQVLSPQRIVVGGGVANTPGLLDRVRRHMVALNGGYISRPPLTEHINSYLVPPQLEGRAGVLGALELARMAYEAHA
jgi:fructokinase